MILWRASGRRGRYSGCRIGAIVLFAAGAVLSALHARAADWSMTSNLSQKVEVDDNFELDADSPGYAISPTSSVSVDITANAPTYTLDLGGGLSYREFTGPGAPTDPDPLSENANAEVEFRGPRHSVGVGGSFARKGATFNETIEEFDELGVTTVDTDRQTVTVGGEVSVDINRTNAVKVSSNYRMVDFGDSNDALVPFTEADLKVAWTHDWSDSTEATLEASGKLFNADDTEDTESETLSISAGVNKDLNGRLSVSGSIGVNVIHSTETSVGARVSDTSVGPIFDVGLGYTLGVTDISLSLRQSVDASALGGLQERRAIKFNLNHRINRRETFGLATNFTIREAAASQTSAAGRDRTLLSVSPTYSVLLSRYWTFEVGYQFRFQRGDDGTGISNRVFGTLSRNFVLLP